MKMNHVLAFFIACLAFFGAIESARSCANGIYVWSTGLASEADFAASLSAAKEQGIRDLYLIAPERMQAEQRQRLLGAQEKTGIAIHAFTHRLKCHPGWQGKCSQKSYAEIGRELSLECKKQWESGFQGCQIDIEPLPATPEGVADYLAAVDAVRSARPAGKLLSVAAPMPKVATPFGVPKGQNAAAPPPYAWSAEDLKKLAARADRVMIMGYDLGFESPEKYSQAMKEAADEVRALAPAASGKIQIGLAAFGIGRHGLHDSRVENAESGLSGIRKSWGASCPENTGISLFHDSVKGDFRAQLRKFPRLHGSFGVANGGQTQTDGR